VIGSIALACLWISANARADLGGAKPGVLVIAAEAKAGSPDAEVIEAVRGALAEIDEVKLLPPSPLDLDAVQLALDCSDESARCLSEIAKRMEAQIVVIPSLRQRRDALELHLTSFKQGGTETASAMRKQAGTRLDATLLETVPSMLREVLKLKAREEEAEEPEPIEPLVSAPIEDPAPNSEAEPDDAIFGLPLGPVLLGGGGLVLIASGIVVGVMASSTEDAYASQAIDNEAQAKRADELRVQGENEAVIANILLGTGASALVAAGIWYVLDARSEHEPSQSASVRPMLAPGSAGLLLTGAWGSP
jgi:hypothetical protein